MRGEGVLNRGTQSKNLQRNMFKRNQRDDRGRSGPAPASLLRGAAPWST